ncbi:hypothetical protein EGW08_020659, partial [Elysia chlorotica]
KFLSTCTDLDESKTLGGSYTRFCNNVFPPLIDSCNISGAVEFLDPEVEQACALYESVFDGKYRNMFCFLCNEPFPYDFMRLKNLVMTGFGANAARLDFAALLDLSGQMDDPVEETRTVEHCNVTQYLDVDTCECRELECSEGKYLSSSGACLSLLETDMLGYTACHRLDISSTEPLPVDRLRFASYMVVQTYAKEHIFQVLHFCPNGLNISLFFEDKVTSYGTLEDLEERIRSIRDVYRSMANDTLTSAVSSRVSVAYPCPRGPMLEDQCPSDPSFYMPPSRMEAPVMEGERTDTYYISYSPTSACPFVSIPRANFTLVEDGEKLLYKPTGNLIPTAQVSFIDSPDSDSGFVRVCISDYKELANSSFCRKDPVDDFDTWSVVGVISVISTVISLVCLVLT